MKPIIIDCSKPIDKKQLEEIIDESYRSGYDDGYKKSFLEGRRGDITITPTWVTSTSTPVLNGSVDISNKPFNPYEIKSNSGKDLVNDAMKTLSKGKRK